MCLNLALYKEAEIASTNALNIAKGTQNEASALNNLAQFLQVTNRLAEAEPLMRRALTILIRATAATGLEHQDLRGMWANYLRLLRAMKTEEPDLAEKLLTLGPEAGWELEKWKVKLGELRESK
jgi:tetratricopeptide (TPR) repeat protein